MFKTVPFAAHGFEVNEETLPARGAILREAETIINGERQGQSCGHLRVCRPCCRYGGVCHILGKGDFRRGRELLDAVAERMDHARKKHPVFAEGRFQALGVIHAEYLELEQAVARGEGKDRERDEALDTATTALRFFIGEHEA